jgi:outer membrane protein assembly factor BamB
MASCADASFATDKPRPPKLPLAEWWSVSLDGPVNVAPATDGTRVYVAYASGQLVARAAADGAELWRVTRTITTPMAAGGDLLFISADETVVALRGATGATAWVLPRVTPVAPLLVDGTALFVVTQTDLLMVDTASGRIVWQRAAGGVRLAPVADADRVYVGADDGRMLALNRADGAVLWERFFSGGVTALGAGGGRVYVGAGDKVLHCLKGARGRDEEWAFRIGAIPDGHVAVGEERVYVGARDNTVRGLDRGNGNQRWIQGLRERPTAGVFAMGHVVFVPSANASRLMMLYDGNGREAGGLALPGVEAPGVVPAFVDTPDGLLVFTVTGSLENEWHLTKFARAGDTALQPFSALDKLPGLPYLTDPALSPIANVLQTLLVNDPLLRPFSEIGFPVVLRDPPLERLTVLPGLQLRPLSPVLPTRRGAL